MKMRSRRARQVLTPELYYAWRRKLRASGFVDIEAPDGTLEHGSRHIERVEGVHVTERAATARYYTIAQHFIHSAAFRRLNRERKAVWRLHAEGMPYRQIAKRLGLGATKVRLAIRAGCVLAKLPAPAVGYYTKQSGRA